MKKLSVFVASLLLSVCAFAQTDEVSGLQLIPEPLEVKLHEGMYQLRNLDVYVESCDRQNDLLEMLAFRLGPATGYKVNQVKSSKASIRFICDETLGQDAYRMVCDKKGVCISAGSYGGYFYGIQTLAQLLPKEAKCRSQVNGISWTVPFVEISDGPRFPWRGLMLDVSRHFFTKEEVMQFIDEMSAYKYNRFHWHLTDDQGWRIEIKSCPELIEKGCMRATRVGDWWKRDKPVAGEPLDYGGYYTREDVKQVIEYAAKRNVEVMPEIDVPGHSVALLVAYPELACFNAPEFVNVGHDFYTKEENAVNPANEKTYEILDRIFGEISEMFPFDYIHIGGDECYRGFWNNSPDCQELCRREGIQPGAGLQSYFVKRVEKIVLSHGKKIIGWDEISEGGLAESATVMSWRNLDGGIEAAKAGHHVIMTPQQYCYLDLYQGEKTVEPATYSMLRLSKSYSLEPVPDGIDPALVLGGQGNLWTEAVPVYRHAQYMTWPRGWALSEVFWSAKEKRDWMGFVDRMEAHFLRADCAQINYSANSVYNAIITTSRNESGDMVIAMDTEIGDIELYYTFDGTNPDKWCSLYTEPLTVPKNAATLRVQSYRNGRKVGNMISLTMQQLEKRIK